MTWPRAMGHSAILNITAVHTNPAPPPVSFIRGRLVLAFADIRLHHDVDVSHIRLVLTPEGNFELDFPDQETYPAFREPLIQVFNPRTLDQIKRLVVKEYLNTKAANPTRLAQ